MDYRYITINPLVLGVCAVVVVLMVLVKRYYNGGVCYANRDLTGKVLVITGGNSGVGKATIEELAHQKCTIIFGARDIKKSEQFLRQIKARKVNAQIIFFPLDLADIQTVDQFAAKVNNQVDKVDILVNNAAVFLLPKRYVTRQNFEMQMGVNHLGHFYLTHKLWPLIKKADKPRIISVASLAHRRIGSPFDKNIPIQFEDLHLAKGYHPALSYSRSKIAKILFTKELQRRMDAEGFKGFAYSLHPGIVRTQVARDVPLSFRLKKYLLYPVFYLISKSMKQGAQTTLYTILEDESRLTKGAYFADCKENWVSQFAGNMGNARKMWQVSEKELNITFNV